MRVVVSDTSPLRALALLNLLSVLDQLYETVYIPPAVRAELSVQGHGVPVVDLALIKGLRERAPTRQSEVDRLRGMNLGAGEAEAIAVCMDVHADGLIADDDRARSVAQRAGIQTIGVLGVLVQAKRLGLTGPIAPLIERLVNELKFRASAALRDSVLRLAGESGS